MLTNKKQKETCRLMRFSLMVGTLLSSGFVLTACSSGSSSPPTVPPPPAPPPPPAAVVVSGALDSGGVAVDVATVRSFEVTGLATDNEFSNATSDANGAYSVSVPDGSANYLEFSKAGFAKLNSPFFTIAQDMPDINIGMISEADANTVIDTAFGGMMFDLMDKAWLAIDVRDATGADIGGVFLTANPPPSGGGALFCNGLSTGANVSTGTPPCNPERNGPMYLAYYDGDNTVTVTASGSSDSVVAPVRFGEVTYFEFSPTATPPTGGGGGVTTGTLSVEVEVGGSVTSNPAILQCASGTTCDVQVPLGTIVTLIGTPAPGNVLDDWDGCDQESVTPTGGTCTKTITEAQTFIRAEFDPAP